MIKLGPFNDLKGLKARQAELLRIEVMLLPSIVNDIERVVANSASGIFHRPLDPLKGFKIDGKIDMPGKSWSYLLPLIINRTVFRSSGFFTKLVVGGAVRGLGNRLGRAMVNWLIRSIRS